ARLCVTGQRRMAEFCEAEEMPFRRSGKVVVASSPDEVPAMDELHRRGTANGLTGIRRLDPEGLREREPNAVGEAALHVPEAGVVDYGQVAVRLAADLDVRLGDGVLRIAEAGGHTELGLGSGALRVRAVVNCGGLHSDRIARMAGIDPPVRI